jgi:hypothetical protein
MKPCPIQNSWKGETMRDTILNRPRPNGSGCSLFCASLQGQVGGYQAAIVYRSHTAQSPGPKSSRKSTKRVRSPIMPMRPAFARPLYDKTRALPRMVRVFQRHLPHYTVLLTFTTFTLTIPFWIVDSLLTELGTGKPLQHLATDLRAPPFRNRLFSIQHDSLPTTVAI